MPPHAILETELYARVCLGEEASSRLGSPIENPCACLVLASSCRSLRLLVRNVPRLERWYYEKEMKEFLGGPVTLVSLEHTIRAAEAYWSRPPSASSAFVHVRAATVPERSHNVRGRLGYKEIGVW